MAYYTRSKFNFAQNILTVQRPGRIPFTIVFAQFFHKFNQPKLTSYWLYKRCPTTHTLSPTQICMITACNFSWVLQSSQEKSKAIRQWLCNFFWCGGSGVGGGEGGGNKVHCGLCENGELLSFCFPTILPFQKNFQRPRCHYKCCRWGSLMTYQSRINFFMMIQINIIHYLRLYG